ncbi:unnamed protein product [Rotaria sp. Silwood2]|nr:unnamed protein product [Rotaria sp. Silwood2]CAF3393439.1 unnamed protein product [Rotaria sp. Silwood2]CAF4533604.1 unnamed protein product [Rotaria sp. Silwood2]CAF4642349.1 unnamed protein product [Rotaria sp. Silwood2]
MKRSNYSKENLLKAVEEYKNGATSTDVSSKYGVPGSTVRNHNYNSQMRFGGGRPTILTSQQEQYLVELLKNLEFIGLRLMKVVVMKLGSEYVKLVTGKSVELGRKWLKYFLNRWKGELKVIKEKKIEASRRNGFTEDIRCGWFEKLELILRTNNLIERPHAIYNCDESGFSDETACEMVIVSHETKQAYEQSGGSGKSFTTSLICGNAAGDILPPFIIYSAKNLNPQWTLGGPPGSSFAISDSGWITKRLFTDWFKSFIEHTKNVSKPVLLIMDNHSCHISIEVIELAKQNQILLLLLPPCCTHALQPLDTATFSSAKQSWKRIVTKYFLRSGRKTIRKIDLPALFKELYSSAFTPKQVLAGFSRAGVWPFDSNSMKEKVARQPLATKQLNQCPQTTSDTPIAAPSIQPSSFNMHDQNKSTTSLGFNNNSENELNYVLNENISISTRAATPKKNPLITTNLNVFHSLDQTINTNRLQRTNQNSNTCSSFENPYDSLRFPLFISNTILDSISFNTLDLPTDEFNNTIIPIDTNSSFMQIPQSINSFNGISLNDVDWIEEDDGQQILGFDPSTLPTTDGRNSGDSNGYQVQQTSIFNFEKDNEEKRIYTELTNVDTSSFVPSLHRVQSAQLDLNQQIADPVTSIQLSPSSAVRSIVTDLLQQHVSPPTLPSKTNKRTRKEGQYGEEITSSNRLNELKEKVSLSSTKKQITTTTTTKRRRLSKQTSEAITLSQTTRALSTLQTLSSSNTTRDQNAIGSTAQ